MTTSEPSHRKAEAARPRWAAVDVLRGLTMAAMIVVNNPGSWSHMSPALAHAEWGAMPALADHVFPTFLFLVGLSTALALGDTPPSAATLRRVARRAAFLFAIGVFLNLFPQFDWSRFRIPGVLQRIAVVYASSALAYLFIPRRALPWLVVGVSLLYAAWLKLVPLPATQSPQLGPDMSWPVWIDDRLWGAHSWPGPGDPEGLPSTLGAWINAAMGLLAGAALRRGRLDDAMLHRMFAVGLGVAAIGFFAAAGIVVAKEVWTPSYAWITSGVSILLLAFALLFLPGERSPRGLAPLRWIGRHALTAYVLAHLVSDLSIHVIRVPWGEGSSLSWHNVVYREFLAKFAAPPLASFLYSCVVLAVVTFVVFLLDRRGWKWKL